LQLINDVALLDSQLKQADCPCDENLDVHLFRDLDGKPLAKRLMLWRFRKDLRQKLVASLSRSTLSAAFGETATTSPPVVKQETEHKIKLEELPFAPVEKQETEHKRKLEEPPFAGPSAPLHDTAKKPKFAYTFTPMGRRRLCRLFTSCGTNTFRIFQALLPASVLEKGRGPREKRTISVKTATLLKFVVQQLHAMARGESPLPKSSNSVPGRRGQQRQRTGGLARAVKTAHTCGDMPAHGPARPPAGGRGGAGTGEGARPAAAIHRMRTGTHRMRTQTNGTEGLHAAPIHPSCVCPLWRRQACRPLAHVYR
jgi:hypothetical protein